MLKHIGFKLICMVLVYCSVSMVFAQAQIKKPDYPKDSPKEPAGSD